ncbi:MAG: hypothetical protein Unbinned4466contig1000_34 [Prokaryotic dsDNA virus sp.]|nr:MAG: hypothetical protein Unbinned4466contig1000_34 [Prokaryotic dsDNA virus sp.]|tara:strand:+ start:15755 stop:16009 length:255 start_codon:yes stop_codon:yes gene_type:complete
MINEQELAEAVDRLREGESVMGVGYINVLDDICSDVELSLRILHSLGEEDLEGAKGTFEFEFNRIAKGMLREALRTHKEQKAGL